MKQATPHYEDEIQLSSESSHRGPSELIELSQVSHIRLQSAHYTIFDERYMSVFQKRPLRMARRYWLDLGLLDPTPHLLTITDWRSLYAAAGLAFGTLVMLLVSVLSSTPWQQQFWLPVTAVLAGMTLIALGAFFLRSHNLVRFHSRSGDAVFLELVNNNPSRRVFGAFLRKVIQHIQTAHKHDPRKPYQKLGAELVEHRRLMEGGILDRDAYDHAREKILRRHRQANIRPLAQVASSRPEPEIEQGEVIEVTIAGDGGWQINEEKRSA